MGLRVTTEKGSMEESKTVRERVLEPGRTLSLHSDNGSEFMNGHLTRFCIARGITFTPRALWSKARGVVRSRPYHKNDHAHVEEKNNSVIRKFVEYDRHDTQEKIDLLNRLYKTLHLLVNWFLPSQKLLHKVRDGSHITKVYDRAQTPEDFRPIRGVLPPVHGCWRGRMFLKRRRNGCDQRVQRLT
jgi:transposase InsO family protein